MALTTHETQVTWSAASSVTLSSTAQVDSDTFTLDDACVAASLQISADNAGTPVSGDTVVVRLKWTSGDILGDSGDDFDTAQHAEFITVLDTFATNFPGEDPARRLVHLNLGGARRFRVAVLGGQASSRNVVVRARVVEQRAA
jgi:hypothetical protein